MTEMEGEMAKKTKKKTRRERIFELARKNPMLRDGELELDENAKTKISEGDDNGAYIQAWMWVSFDDTDLDKDNLT